MSKFKDALERGKKAKRHKQSRAEGHAPLADFGAQAKAWLDEVVISVLEAAKGEVAEDVNIEIVTAPEREVKAIAPSVKFQVYPKRRDEKTAVRTFTVTVGVSGEVSVSAPGMVAEDVGNIGERSEERFRSFVARLIEEVAKENAQSRS
ncbi:MAG: hypothetical protein EOQ52_06960 [Mesorhizobium sp.]|uniref:hypothetical protein n=1 Tax=Mesorhizobium sp. TaxID=1871066 RepID=UPI000FE5A14E|nr:hypothetical protein [Mesorhizobium sp.]RWB91160.1 MAG: hypothetical protein EOQ52_06960 [Mesorhizobium sp.]